MTASWRAGFAVAALVGVLGLAGCMSAPAPSAAAPKAGAQALDPPLRPGVPTIEERFTPEVPAELRVRDPLDARGLDPCALLTPEQLRGSGLDPGSAEPNPGRYGPGCSWQLRDGSTSAGIDLITDPNAAKLPDFWRLRGNAVVFEIRQVAGHPAIRSDYVPNECDLALAIADYQIVGINAYADGRVLPDPCGPAVRMAELIIANLAARP
ncbi:MAG: DUF3558 domain-containing protein [Pseudonocardia sp.]